MEKLAVGLLLAQLTVLLTFTGCKADWPDGTYGLPMPETGCPETNSFVWNEGSRLQKTEKGSYGSDPVHLAGIKTEESSTILQKFCIKRKLNEDNLGSGGQFMPGMYCIYRKGDCPSGFKSGTIYWDDAAPWYGSTIQSSSGVLPDGTYDRNTLIKYCCRDDKMYNKEIVLPTSSPFHLLRLGEHCQKVKGMDVKDEFINWADEDLLTNTGYASGLHPKVTRNNFPTRFTKLYFCYYTKEAPNKNMKTTMTVIYVILGVAGAVLGVCLIMCLLQRLLHCFSHKKEYDDNNTVNTAREEMLNEVHTEPASTSSGPSVAAATADAATPTRKIALRRDGPQVVEPPRYSTLPTEAPRYSTLPGAAPPTELTEDGEPYTAVLPEESRPMTMSQPPSYDDVLKEDSSKLT